MRIVVGTVAGVAIVGLLALTLAALSRESHLPAECGGRIVFVPTPRGAPLECVCEAGVLSSWFNPGP
jgi:hypothetical protein